MYLGEHIITITSAYHVSRIELRIKHIHRLSGTHPSRNPTWHRNIHIKETMSNDLATWICCRNWDVSSVSSMYIPQNEHTFSVWIDLYRLYECANWHHTLKDMGKIDLYLTPRPRQTVCTVYSTQPLVSNRNSSYTGNVAFGFIKRETIICRRIAYMLLVYDNGR